jgi:hypothetical protein
VIFQPGVRDPLRCKVSNRWSALQARKRPLHDDFGHHGGGASKALHYLVVGSAFPAADDEAEKPEVELTCGLGLLKMLSPLRKFVGRQYPGCLRFRQVSVQETMRKRVINADGVRYAGDLG